MKAKLYCGIDLHSNNSMVVLIDDEDRVVYEKRLPNTLEVILFELLRYRKKIAGVVVESTFNWYWLVDGLQEEGNLRACKFPTKEIVMLEKAVHAKVDLRPEYENLLSVDGIGKILALTIMLETGDISRFGKAGNFASYCQCVDSRKISNEKKKGVNNGKNGNKYLAWAFA